MDNQDTYWESNFNTALSPEQENAFQNWATQQSRALGRNVANDIKNYDLRGFWTKTSNPNMTTAHLPDTYKKPNHPTFSDESIYHNTPDSTGKKFVGGSWIGDDKTGWSFRASPQMVKDPVAKANLQQYFADYEPDAALVMPTINVR